MLEPEIHREKGPSRVAHCFTTYILLSGHENLDIQCKDPMNNDLDCRVGRLTTSRVAFSLIAEDELLFGNNEVKRRPII